MTLIEQVEAALTERFGDAYAKVPTKNGELVFAYGTLNYYYEDDGDRYVKALDDLHHEDLEQALNQILQELTTQRPGDRVLHSFLKKVKKLE